MEREQRGRFKELNEAGAVCLLMWNGGCAMYDEELKTKDPMWYELFDKKDKIFSSFIYILEFIFGEKDVCRTYR